MITTYKNRHLTWVDLNNPTKEEARKIMEKYNIYPSVADELLSPSIKPKVDLYKDSIYLILHFPAAKHTHSNEENQEVDFIITKDTLITTRYDTIDPMHKFSKEFEVSAMVSSDDETTPTHAGFLFCKLVKKLYGSLEHELEYIGVALGEVEHKIYNGREKEMVFEISDISRVLLDFKQSYFQLKNLEQL